jgi:lysophospholipase L1-like esterase
MYRKWGLFILGIALICIAGTMKNPKGSQIKYVALGDSYTIGEGAKSGESFPELLAKHLKENGINIVFSANPSVTGLTTEDLIEKELPVFDKIKPDFVTLLIGVNDWVQGVDSNTFHKNLTYIIDHIQSLLPNKSKVLLITIPDFGVTPTGKMYSGGREICKGITDFNNIIKSEAHNRKLPVADIFPESQKMKNNSELIAHDGLHPSAKEYAMWEKIIYPVAYKLL